MRSRRENGNSSKNSEWPRSDTSKRKSSVRSNYNTQSSSARERTLTDRLDGVEHLVVEEPVIDGAAILYLRLGIPTIHELAKHEKILHEDNRTKKQNATYLRDDGLDELRRGEARLNRGTEMAMEALERSRAANALKNGEAARLALQ